MCHRLSQENWGLEKITCLKPSSESETGNIWATDGLDHSSFSEPIACISLCGWTRPWPWNFPIQCYASWNKSVYALVDLLYSGFKELVCWVDMLACISFLYSVVSIPAPTAYRYTNTSEVNFVHYMKMTAFLTNSSAVGMGWTGKSHLRVVAGWKGPSLIM